MEEILIVAAVLNVLLLLIGYFASSRGTVVVSSIVWILIGFGCFQSYSAMEDIDTTYLMLIIAITYMIAITQVFIPLRESKL